jgi:hypothetical protein
MRWNTDPLTSPLSSAGVFVLRYSSQFDKSNVSRNKKKEMLTSAPGYVKIQNGEFLDLTDMENPGLSYSLRFSDCRISVYIVKNSK